MKIKNLLIVPEQSELADSVKLARQFGCGFEYQDFFVPSLLDDEATCDSLLKRYMRKENRPAFSTFHGVFLDIAIFSSDSAIYEASDLRVEQSLLQAELLGARGVVFHTNYMPNFTDERYRKHWVDCNERYWRKKLAEYPSLQIYIENMFDNTPELIAKLGERMRDEERFGLCFDYAHAQVFGDESRIDDWVNALAPYVKHLHINDNDFVSDMHLPVGAGKTDWGRFRQYYETYFTDCTVLIEVSGNDNIRKSLEYIDAL